MKAKILILIIGCIALSVFMVSAVGDIAIRSVDTTEISPGETSQIRIILQNQGTEDIENVAVSLDLSSEQLPFAPVNSAAQKIVDEIEEGTKETVSFELVALPDAKPRIYKIPLTVAYNTQEEKTVISINVKSEAILEVALDESKIIKVGDSGEIIIRFVNKGLSDIKFVSAEIIPSPDYDILSAPSVYIGNVEPDDFETAIFNLHVNKKINFVPIKIEYRDADNNKITKTEFLNINIYTIEEAQRLGLVKNNNTPYVIGTIILIVVIFIIWRILRKRRLRKV